MRLRRRCARFVLSVDFRVYNRWGKEIYNYQSGGERSIYIDWDGKDSNGNALQNGKYTLHVNAVDTQGESVAIRPRYSATHRTFRQFPEMESP